MKSDSFIAQEEELLELIDGVKSGDTDCFEQLYRLYARRVYGVAKSFYLEHEDAEEMVQEVFFKLWKNRSTLKPELSLQSYIITITRNTVIKFLRSRTVRVNYLNELLREPDAGKNTTEENYHYSELQNKLSLTISKLSPQRQKVFNMVKIQGFKIDEVADMLGLSKRTVEHHLFHASKFVKNDLSLSIVVALVFYQII